MFGGDKMDELMQKIQSVLSDEESMNQIRQLASMFGGSNNDNTSDTQNPPSTQQNNSSDTQSSESEINMNDISKLLASLGGDNSQTNNNAQANVSQNNQSNILNPPNSNQQNSDQLPFDIGKIMTLGSIISNASKADKNTELLLALKPHLKEEKQNKVDKVIKIFKLISIWPAIKDSGLLGGDLFGIL